jgi:succinate-acetate transporter protein
MVESLGSEGRNRLADMKRTHPALWGAGWAGLFVGTALAAVGASQPGELTNMAGGYGLMLAGSAVYLLAGLKIRDRLSRRLTPITATTTPSSASR